MANLTKADRRKASRTRRASVDRDRVGPTPETLAKLLPDPLTEMHRMGIIDTATKDAALELRSIFAAIAGASMIRGRAENGGGGRATMTNAQAWIHANRYLRWSGRWSRIRFHASLADLVRGSVHNAVMDLVVEGAPITLPEIARALEDYARIRRDNPMPRPEDLERAVA